MDSILTVRIDSAIKEEGTAAMKECGVSPSQAIRKLFDYAAVHKSLPFETKTKTSKAEIKKKIAAFDNCHTKEPLTLSDDEIRSERLAFKHAIDA